MNKIFILFLVLVATNAAHANVKSLSTAFPADGQCVLIYYDVSKNPNYKLGKVYSVYAQNLLAHFPELVQIISPIERYKKGEIEKCKSTIYIGSYFENDIPDDFYIDFQNTKKHVAWLGYNIWKFPAEEMSKMFGYNYESLTTLDTKNLTKEGNPSFFKYVEYKGEQFEKFSKWVTRDGQPVFAAPFEQVSLKKDPNTTNLDVKVLALSRHDKDGRKIPYALRSGNRFYIADIPFSYAHESDRYLVFSDLLFDIVDLPPRNKDKIALMRIEDVHPNVPIRNLNLLKNVFKDEGIPLHISLVPIYFDPLFRDDREPEEIFLPITSVPRFMNWIKDVQKDNGVFIWHGATHQYKDIPNPHSGISTDDFEFWDAVNNKPLSDDSVNFVLDRLDLGSDYLKEVNIFPKIWLTPHYQASALDYHIFADVFDWNIGRVIYFIDEPTKLSRDPKLLEQLKYGSKDGGDKNLRRQFFKDFETDVDGEWFGQLYPYEVYGDVYGQRVFPEILGNPQPFTSDHVWYPRSLAQMLEDARRNLVLRDTWASSFFHPYLLTDIVNAGIGDYPGDTRPLTNLLRGMKKLGYKFINLEDFVDQTKNVKNTKRIEIKLDNSWENKK